MPNKSEDLYKIFMSMPNPLAAERDYMECAILQNLFTDQIFADQLVFAGGATLTKAYNICSRISHDIDLACTSFQEISSQRSKGQLRKFRKRFKDFICSTMLDQINYMINQDGRFKITTDRDERKSQNPEQNAPYPTLHIKYNSALNGRPQKIFIEITPRKYSADAISHPAITPYSIHETSGQIPTVAISQTFWDKIFALHSVATTGMPKNSFFLSRHYFDVSQMMDIVNLAETHHMFRDTVDYQSRYTTKDIQPIKTASDIQLVPDATILDTIGTDYAACTKEFLSTPPQWRDIVSRINILQQTIHNLSSINNRIFAYVYSDPHFFSEKIIGYGQRPFKSVQEMNETLIANYNMVVGKNELCYWLGDVMYGATKEKVRHILSQMHGRKYLILGNHDRTHSVSWWLDAGFDKVFEHPVYIATHYVMLSHEPLPEFGNNPPIVNIHGHIHIQDYGFKNHAQCINVSVEKTDYKPVPLINPYITASRVFER